MQVPAHVMSHVCKYKAGKAVYHALIILSIVNCYYFKEKKTTKFHTIQHIRVLPRYCEVIF